MPTLASSARAMPVDVERALERARAGAGRPRWRPPRRRASRTTRELVAAEPRERVVVAHAGAEPRPDLAQHLVAGMVAQRVVELLEAVEVDEQERELVAARDRRLEAVEQVPAVAQAGQVVGQRLALAHAQPLDHREPRARHAGQHRDDREGGGDAGDARELSHRKQRERGRREGKHRHEHDRAELRAGIRARILAQPRRRAAAPRAARPPARPRAPGPRPRRARPTAPAASG